MVCTCHVPPLPAEDESGQHLYDLPRIRREIANRDEVVEAWHAGQLDNRDDSDAYFGRNSARFLADHPHCVIGIRDEYGRWHSLTETSEAAS
jgi:hypothetical protein